MLSSSPGDSSDIANVPGSPGAGEIIVCPTSKKDYVLRGNYYNRPLWSWANMEVGQTMISQTPGLPGTLAISLESPGDEDNTSVGVRRAGTHSGPPKPPSNFQKVPRISGPAEGKNRKKLKPIAGKGGPECRIAPGVLWRKCGQSPRLLSNNDLTPQRDSWKKITNKLKLQGLAVFSISPAKYSFGAFPGGNSGGWGAARATDSALGEHAGHTARLAASS